VIAEVAKDMRRSQAAFLNHVWPVVAEKMGGGEVISMELSDDRLRKLFDATSGIDAWQYRDGLGMWGIASRVQPIGRDYASFTVRESRRSGARTEFEKLWDSVNADDGRVAPYWFVQAYMDSQSTTLLSVGVARMRSVLEFIRMDCDDQDKRRCHDGSSSFWVARWDRMMRRGFDVKVYR
jgi:hypothetical protein